MPHPYQRKAPGKELRKAPAVKAASKTTRKIYVSWTDAEKEALARDSLMLLSQFPDLSRAESLRRAVMRLPKERRRPISDITHNQWVLPLWEQFAQEKDAMNEAQAAPTPESAQDALNKRPGPFVMEGAAEAPSEPLVDGVAIDAVHAKQDKRGSPEAMAKRKKSMKGTKLVRWTDAERRTVAKGFLKLKADFPDMKPTQLVERSMQYNLPDHRQRDVQGYGGCKRWLEPLLLEVESEVALEREAAAQHRLEIEAIERAEIEHKNEIGQLEQTAQELAELAAVEARATALAEFRGSVSIEELLGMVARKLVKAIARPLIEGIREEIVGAMAEVEEEPRRAAGGAINGQVSPPRRERPKLYIVGLDRQQEAELKKVYASRLDIAFGSVGDETGSGISGKAGNADACIAMVDHLSHKTSEAVHKAAKRYVPLTGALSTVKRWIEQWLTGEGKLAA
jgi:hypothetical protein